MGRKKKQIDCQKVLLTIDNEGLAFSSLELFIVNSDHPKLEKGRYLDPMNRKQATADGYTVKTLPVDYPMDIHEVKDDGIVIHKPKLNTSIDPDIQASVNKNFWDMLETLK